LVFEREVALKKNWLVKTLALGIVVLFIGMSCSSAVSVDTKTSVINNQNIENKSYVDQNIHLTRNNLPMLKRSFNYFRNSNFYDAEIGKVMEQIIKLIELKGSVNSEDVENILINSGIISLKIHANCKISGRGCDGFGFNIPLLFLNVLTLFLFNVILIGIGGYLHWAIHYPKYEDFYSDITVGSKTYNTPHIGYAFGFFGIGSWTVARITYADSWLYIDYGYALIVFVQITQN